MRSSFFQNARLICVITLIISGLWPALVKANSQETISEKRKVEIIDAAAELIVEKYAVAEMGAEIAHKLRAHLQAGALDNITNPSDFASALTTFLKPFDIHFSVRWSIGQNENEQVGTIVEPNPFGADNYGFENFNLLSGNVAYWKISNFALVDPTDEKDPALKRAEAAMAMTTNAEAIIIDLRECRGGSPEMVQFIVSYFFDSEPRLIDRLYWRPDGQTYEFWTLKKLNGVRHPEAPLFILTSGRTASACEAFAYDMQAFSRGIIIGQKTLGAANPGETFSIGAGFTIFISAGLVENATTGTNWGGGLNPDFKSPYKDTIRIAHRMAIDALLVTAKPETYAKNVLTWTKQRYAAEDAPIFLKGRKWRRAAGTYGSRLLTFDQQTLFYRRSNGEPVRRLIALGDNTFAMEGFDTIRLIFERDEQGKFTSLTELSASGSRRRFDKN
ncbi:MAG: hypothetical protein DHS20C05_23100 [Hyphococcus sp.]|nr:MAG: hypothetical protein DHS20C05_23100 [Marinicaulis sp.]